MAPIRSWALFLVSLTVPVFPQAWLPAKGEGYVSIGFQTMFIGHHLSSFGKSTGTSENIRSNAASMGLTYGVTDRFAVAVSIPFIATRYLGSTPHGDFDGPTRLDDGSYHGTFQDFRIDTHYNLIRRSVMVTPFFTLAIPSHHYDTFGHAAQGRDLREYQAGFDLGYQLRPFLPRAYTNLRYGYAFVQNIADISTDRSNVDLELGYFLKPSVVVRGFGNWQRTHGGLENSPNFNLPPHQYHLHDRVWRAHYLRLGGGVIFSLRPNLDLYTAVMATPSGKNAERNTAIGVGISWRFTRRPENELPAALQNQTGDPGGAPQP